MLWSKLFPDKDNDQRKVLKCQCFVVVAIGVSINHQVTPLTCLMHHNCCKYQALTIGWSNKGHTQHVIFVGSVLESALLLANGG